MKPVETIQNVAASGTASILERLKSVDVSSLDQLLAIREEQHRIESYRRRADELKDGVSSVVHARVLEDYANRESDLRRRSIPLEQLARAEYRKLRQLLDEAQHNEEQANLQKEELEFRHAVGELDDEQTAERLREPIAALERSATDRSALDQHATRFVQAIGSDAILAEPEASWHVAVESAPPAAAEHVPTEAASEGHRNGSAVSTSPPPVPDQVLNGPIAPASDVAGLGAFSAEELFASEQTMFAAESSRSSSAADDLTLHPQGGGLDQVNLPPAALLLTELSAPPREYRLFAVNGIGRSPENQIQVVKPGISRMHAVVTFVNGGFSIKDLESQNGTFVNGDRIGERVLVDGDLVDVGTVQFVFRLPWPSPAQPAAAKTAARLGQKR